MTTDVKPMYDIVQKRDERITSLVEADKMHDERLKLLEDRSIKLENTVMTESLNSSSSCREISGEQRFTLDVTRSNYYRRLAEDIPIVLSGSTTLR